MMRRYPLLLALAALPACSLRPAYVRPALPVPPSWPTGDAYLRQSEAPLPTVTYRDIFRDERLQRVIDQALANNRDLRIAAANIAAARGQYRIQRSELLPTVNGTANYSRRDNGSGTATGTPITGGTGGGNNGAGVGDGTGNDGGVGGGVGGGNNGTIGTNVSGARNTYSVQLGITAFEIDLFGRIRSLTDAALARYFGQEATARATRLTLVGDVANAWFTYAADASLLKVAQDTARNAERAVRLTRSRLQGGIAPRTDVRQAEQILYTAQADLAQQRTLVAQDTNALQLLVGAPVDPALLPATIEEAQARVAELPAGLDSGILLRRPDVVQAEYELRATNAEIGAARAELFPRLSLTGLLGFASTSLGSLFDGGAFNYSVSPNASYPIFRAGAGRAGVEVTQAQRDAALATYERTIQIAFREVSDALARRGTITDQLTANERFYDAARDTFDLADQRYRGGIDTFLAALDAQRQLYAAQQNLVNTRLLRATNLVTLYRTLGGDAQLDALPTGPVPATGPVPPRP